MNARLLSPDWRRSRKSPGGRPRGSRVAASVVALLGLVACEDVVVEPVDVEILSVIPETADLALGSTLQLAAEARDREGRALSGHSVAWSSDDPAVATVDGGGRVTGAGPGTTVIRASAGSAEGTASLTVLAGPVISLDRESVGFVADAGAGAPAPVKITIRNTGGGDLRGLTTTTSYESGGPSGWLAAALAGTRAPTTLTLTATPGDLEPGTYRATVEVRAESGTNSPQSVAVALEVREGPVGSTPAAPSDLSATARSASSIGLKWSDNSDNETDFRIERRTDGAGFAQIASVGAGATSYEDSGLDAATSYTYRVRACNAGDCSAYSAEASATTESGPSGAPATPTNLQATYEDGAIQLQWTDVAGETGYRVERRQGEGSFALLATTGSDAASYRDGKIDDDAEYTYRVRACNDSECSDPSGQASSLTPPAAPSNLRSPNVKDDRVKLLWDDNSSSEERFRIERARGDGDFAFLANVGPNVTSYDDEQVEEETRYRYRVRACNAAGCSSTSDVLTVTTPDD